MLCLILCPVIFSSYYYCSFVTKSQHILNRSLLMNHSFVICIYISFTDPLGNNVHQYVMYAGIICLVNKLIKKRVQQLFKKSLFILLLYFNYCMIVKLYLCKQSTQAVYMWSQWHCFIVFFINQRKNCKQHCLMQ